MFPLPLRDRTMTFPLGYRDRSVHKRSLPFLTVHYRYRDRYRDRYRNRYIYRYRQRPFKIGLPQNVQKFFFELFVQS
jgi:hypothetical protein